MNGDAMKRLTMTKSIKCVPLLTVLAIMSIFSYGLWNINLVPAPREINNKYNVLSSAGVNIMAVQHSQPNTVSEQQREVQRHKINGTWDVMRGKFELYAYSAYYDDRKSLGTLPVIRVIAVSQYIEGRTLFCRVWYDNILFPKTVQIKYDSIGAGIPSHNKGFREYMIECPLDDENVPSKVSILPTEHDSPSFILVVQVPQVLEPKLNFISCVSVTYWKHDPYHIIEWMELLRLFGVSTVTIYNNSLSDEAARVFKHYDKEGFVDFRQSHTFFQNDRDETAIHAHMSPVINDCVYRNMYRVKKIVVTDLDEIIVPRQHLNYTAMLDAVDVAQPTGHAFRHYTFQNNYFFLDIPGGGDLRISEKIHTLHYRKKAPLSEYGYAIKSIIDPLACVRMHNHYCWGLTKLYERWGDRVDVDTSIAINQHYKKCHLKPEECQQNFKDSIEDTSMLRFMVVLLDRIKKKKVPTATLR